MIEAVISTLIVAIMFAAVLGTVSASKKTQYVTGSRSRAMLLVQALMCEILTKRYQDPDSLLTFGPESDESSSFRIDWDDVDDYHGWSSSPPTDRDGADIAGLGAWTRSVEVVWVNPVNISATVGTDSGAKRITVTVTHGGLVLASLVTVRTDGWPKDEDQEPPLTVLLVVADEDDPDAQELARQTLMQSWGFVVEPISASATQGAFDDAADDADVAYISATINAGALGTKLRDVEIGVVDEEADLYDELGFSANSWPYGNQTKVGIVDATHYITSPFGVGDLTIFSSKHTFIGPDEQQAGGLQELAEKTSGGWPLLTVLETGAQLSGGGSAAGRRVQLPWADDSFDFGLLTADGQTIMKRAIEWAANKEQQ